MGCILKEVWHFPVDMLVKIIFYGNPEEITGVLYEQNKSNETIQGHESDAAVHYMPIDEMSFDIQFISII